jgi:hypothetical protein
MGGSWKCVPGNPLYGSLAAATQHLLPSASILQEGRIACLADQVFSLHSAVSPASSAIKLCPLGKSIEQRITGSCLCAAWIRFRISFSSSNVCRLRLVWAMREFVRPAWSWQELNSKKIQRSSAKHCGLDLSRSAVTHYPAGSGQK